MKLSPYVVAYDILMNFIIIFIVKGGAINSIPPQEAVAIFAIHNAITSWLLAIRKENTISWKALTHINSSGCATLTYYTVMKLFGFAVLAVLEING